MLTRAGAGDDEYGRISMDLVATLRTTGAVRAFTDDPVPDEVVWRILDTARFAPSGGNRQPWRVVVVKDPATRQKVGDLNRRALREYFALERSGQRAFALSQQGRWPGPRKVDLDAAHRIAHHLGGNADQQRGDCDDDDRSERLQHRRGKRQHDAAPPRLLVGE